METEYEFKLNSYESFMRRHLQYYGYYTGQNDRYRGVTSDWQNQSSDSSDSSSDSDDNFVKTDSKYPVFQEELLRTTQIVYSYEPNGRMVPRLREPRQLYALTREVGPQQAPRWPADIEVTESRIHHLHTSPAYPEPLYVPTGCESTPTVRGEDMGNIVFRYDPSISYFARSRVGGIRIAGDEISSGGHDEMPSLVFESRFECGNLAKAIQVRENDYELWLRYDLYTNKHTQWFYFRVGRTRPGVTYRFTIVNFMKPDSLYNMGMRPLMYSEKEARDHGIGWLRTGSDIKYYKNNKVYETKKGEKSFYSLTWTVQFPYDDDNIYFAHCYPYSYSDLQEYLVGLASDPRTNQLCKQRVLCHTLAGNVVCILTVTSPATNPDDARQKKAVVLTARVHPGESNSSWMMKGFLDFLLGTSADAQVLRDMFIFKIVPMLNPDGVIVGNYRCSLSGRDLNRNYRTKLKDAFPSVWHTRNMINRLLEEREVIVYCDLHGHSRKQNVFIYGCENRYDPMKRLRERIFPAMLSKNASDKFKFESCKFKVQKNKEGTGRVVMWNLGILNSFTMEATFCGSSLGRRKGSHFNISDYEQMGFHFLDTLLDYCDPDGTKCNDILLSLEEKIKLDILAKMDVMGLSTDDIDLNSVDFSSIMDESSDGGSDSSVSDGLPVHLKYTQCLETRSKTKKLKTRKERNKVRSKCPPEELPAPTPMTKAPPATEVHQNMNKNSTDIIKPASVIPCVLETNKSTQKVESGYLEELTKTYMENGVDVALEKGAHLRYATKKAATVQDCSYDLCSYYDSGLFYSTDSKINNTAFPAKGNERRDSEGRVRPCSPLAVFSHQSDNRQTYNISSSHALDISKRILDPSRLVETKKIETRALGDINTCKLDDGLISRDIGAPLRKKLSDTGQRQLEISTVKQQREPKQMTSSTSNPTDPELASSESVSFSLSQPITAETQLQKQDASSSLKSQKLWTTAPPTTPFTGGAKHQDRRVSGNAVFVDKTRDYVKSGGNKTCSMSVRRNSIWSQSFDSTSLPQSSHSLIHSSNSSIRSGKSPIQGESPPLKSGNFPQTLNDSFDNKPKCKPTSTKKIMIQKKKPMQISPILNSSVSGHVLSETSNKVLQDNVTKGSHNKSMHTSSENRERLKKQLQINEDHQTASESPAPCNSQKDLTTSCSSVDDLALVPNYVSPHFFTTQEHSTMELPDKHPFEICHDNQPQSSNNQTLKLEFSTPNQMQKITKSKIPDKITKQQKNGVVQAFKSSTKTEAKQEVTEKYKSKSVQEKMETVPPRKSHSVNQGLGSGVLSSINNTERPNKKSAFHDQKSAPLTTAPTRVSLLISRDHGHPGKKSKGTSPTKSKPTKGSSKRKF